MRFGYPILLDVSGRLIVIVGGGSVAVRKVRSLLESGADQVRLVAPHIEPGVAGGVERVLAPYEPKHLEGAGLVFALTDSAEVNSRVVQDAQKRGIPVCRADEHEEHPGDFISPAVHREGVVTVAVSAGSAALSAMIRDGIAARLDPRWVRMAETMRVLRPRIRDDQNLSPARRRAIFRDLADEGALAAATAGPEHVWRWLVSKHPDLARH